MVITEEFINKLVEENLIIEKFKQFLLSLKEKDSDLQIDGSSMQAWAIFLYFEQLAHSISGYITVGINKIGYKDAINFYDVSLPKWAKEFSLMSIHISEDIICPENLPFIDQYISLLETIEIKYTQ